MDIDSLLKQTPLTEFIINSLPKAKESYIIDCFTSYDNMLNKFMPHDPFGIKISTKKAKNIVKPSEAVCIVLPSSFFTNCLPIYSAARETILRDFEIIAIARLGTNAFKKTRFNMISLFLKRREGKDVRINLNSKIIVIQVENNKYTFIDNLKKANIISDVNAFINKRFVSENIGVPIPLWQYVETPKFIDIFDFDDKTIQLDIRK